MRVRLTDGGAVSAIIVNNKPLREHGGRDSENAVVFLQPESEYAIRLKNQTKRRAGVRVFVDGSPITDDFVVIDAGGESTIDRWLFDEHSGSRLKFVKAGSNDASPQVQLPGDASNGLVEIEWYFEREDRDEVAEDIRELLKQIRDKPVPQPYPVPVYPWRDYYWRDYWWDRPYRPYITWCGSGTYSSAGPIGADGLGSSIGTNDNDVFSMSGGGTFCCNSADASANIGDAPVTANYLHVSGFAPLGEPTDVPDGHSITEGGMGATVEGSTSYSHFKMMEFVPASDAEAVMKFVLRTSERNVTTARTRKIECECGRQVKWGDNFCPGCGCDMRGAYSG